MKTETKSPWRFRLVQIGLGSLLLFAIFAAPRMRAENEPIHMTTDWSDHHLRFSPPHNLMQQFQLSANARYVRQWIRQNTPGGERDWGERWMHFHRPDEPLDGDWNVYMGNVGTVGAGNYPAKYSFSTAAANCGSATQPDFVVYNTSLTGSTTAVAAMDTGTFSAAAGSGSTITITNGANTLTMTAGTANANTGTGTGTWNATGAGSGTAATNASNLVTALNTAGNGSHVGVSATSTGAVVTITATTAGTAENSITVAAQAASNLTWTFANLVDGASGVPTIVAFDNLYSGCSGTVPSPYWAYITGTAGAVVTSPVFSGDGTQVSFVQGTAGAAELVLLKWAADGSTPDSPTNMTGADTVTNANYRTCTAPCLTTITFSGGATRTDTSSSPFYDYTIGSDTMYVGDSQGYVHKFTGVFLGTPAEVTTAPWPVQAATAALSSPIYDVVTGNIYVSTSFQTSNNSGGRLHSICAAVIGSCTAVGNTDSTGILGPVTTTSTHCTGTGTSGGTANLLMDAPVVDPTNGVIYVALGNDGNGNSALYQFSNNWTSQSCGVEVTLGTGTTSNPSVPVYAGSFDHFYLNGAAGNFYICGDAGGDPTLYQITVPANGVLTAGAATVGPALATATTTCGPVVEIYNTKVTGGAVDWIFTNVQASPQTASPISCPSSSLGCIMSFNVTSGAAISSSTTTVGHTSVAGGASGVIVDNIVASTTLAGTSQVYFTPLASGNCTTSTGQGIGGCAVQASQSALQ